MATKAAKSKAIAAKQSDADRRKSLAQAIYAWVGDCSGLKVDQSKGKNLYSLSYAESLATAEINFPEYTEVGTFYRGLQDVPTLSNLIGLSADYKTFVCDSCQCASRAEVVAQQRSHNGLILIFKNCLAIDAKLALESNDFSYGFKSEKEMIIPAYQSFRVVSIVGKYITLEEN